jgi:glucose-6-phosphate-specific signal transduction histidine kinase
MRFRNSDEVQFDFKFECQQVLKHFELEKKLINFTKNEKLASQMSNLVDFWSPLLVCQIEIDVNETKINKIPVNRIIDLVNESLSNALRHEKAKSVRIQLLDFINDVLVVVTNDGELIRSIRKGLDSKLFDEPTNERWEITNMSENTGVRFSGLVPIN